jgi:hypothetical protein
MRYRSLLLSAVISLQGCAALQLNPEQQAVVIKSQPAAFSAQGWGGTICQEMLKDIHPTNKSVEAAAANVSLYQSWISGFISGANYAFNEVYDLSGEANPNDSFEWIKQYCLQYPIDPIPLALHKLIQEWQQTGKIIYDAN